MAKGTIHPQKPDGQRRRRNAPTHDTTTLVRDNILRGPSLEQATGRSEDEWLPQVAMWWNTWRASPQAQAFESTDWLRLATLAPIVESYWTKPTASALSEIRMNEERLGATVVDRMRARFKIEDSEDGRAAEVVSLADSREALKARLRAAPETEDEQNKETH